MKKAEKKDIVFKEIRQLIQELHPELRSQPTVSIDSVLDRDLGLDSLSRMELLARIEKALNVRLPEKVLTTAETPRDILRPLEKLRPSPAEPLPEAAVIDIPATSFASTAHEAKTLTEVLIGHAQALPDQIHIYVDEFSDGEKTLTFGELYNGAKKMAAGLQQHDLEPGDTVAIMLPTSTGYFFSFFAVLLAGCVPVPLYPPMRPSQIEEHLLRHKHILTNARAKILITVPEIRLIGRLLQAQIDTLRSIVTVEELITREKEFVPIPCHGDDIAFLQYTSGSTGDPKGVILTHANLLANIRAMGQATEAGPSDIFVSAGCHATDGFFGQT
jgi:non-ribosomal peptide synthetase component F